jgi:hypothetical protein
VYPSLCCDSWVGNVLETADPRSRNFKMRAESLNSIILNVYGLKPFNDATSTACYLETNNMDEIYGQ